MAERPNDDDIGNGTKSDSRDKNGSNDERDDGRQSDIEALEVTREVGRAVIDHQIENLSGLNDKAAQTIRFNVLILGVVLTVFSLALNSSGGYTSNFVNGAIVAGVLLSGVSILAALWAYTSSRKEVGPTGLAMEQVIEGDASYSKRQWLRGVIRGQSNWIAENERVNRSDAFALFISHLYLFVSIGMYAFGVVWGLELQHLSTAYYWSSIAVLAALLPSLVILPGQISEKRVPNAVQNFVDDAITALMQEE